MPLLALEYLEGWSGEEVYMGFSFVTRRLEFAGRAFREIHEGFAEDEEGFTSPKQDGATAGAEKNKGKWSHAARKKKKGGGGGNAGGSGGGCNNSSTDGATSKTLLHRVVQGPSLYKILEITEGASTDEIRKAYRRLALKYHPDKQQDTGGGVESSKNDVDSSITELFLQLQEAYEVLMDDSMRRAYDSAVEFDDGVFDMSYLKRPDDFLDVVRPVFERNSKFSVRKPVPVIGDESTSLETVQEFYEFWFSFESWRDFAIHDEYDLNEAECREERRWMERQNARIRKKFEVAEKKRVQGFVSVAHAKDPRLIRAREETARKQQDAKELRQRQLEEENERRRIEEETARRITEEEARVKAEEDARATSARRAEKKRIRECRQFLREVHRERCAVEIDVVRLDNFLLLETLECLEKTVEDVQNNSKSDAGSPIAAALERAFQSSEKLRVHEEAQLLKVNNSHLAVGGSSSSSVGGSGTMGGASTATNSWTPEELSLMAKALQKYPGGVARRWAQIATYIGSRSIDEIISKARELLDAKNLKDVGQTFHNQAFDQFVSQNKNALKIIEVPVDVRLDDVVAEDKSVQRKPVGQQHHQLISPTASTTASLGSSASQWTLVEQQLLETALKTFPPIKGRPSQERWDAIANMVPGRSRKDCVERFKACKAAVNNPSG